MENDILDSLEDLGYKGPLLEDGALDEAVTGGASSPEFTKLCAWLVSELKLYCKLEENVQATNSPNESEGFQLEMSGLLSEMMCPYSVLTSGDVTKRLLNKNNCLLLLTYLISELEASKMIQVNKPSKAPQQQGSEVFNELKGICMGLGMSKPPANITMFQFFSGIEKKLKEALSKVPPNHVGKPLMKKPLGPIHWEKVEAINQALVNEYEVRRKMLLKRLDVTVQSFGWSERAKVHTEKLAKVYQPKRAALGGKSGISVANLFAAREDLSKILRTSSGRTREKTACAINKVLMGRVPDRGGRPNEIEPPPPEMPPWQKRQDGPQQFGGGGRGGGGRGGYDGQFHGGRGGYDGQSHGGRGGSAASPTEAGEATTASPTEAGEATTASPAEAGEATAASLAEAGEATMVNPMEAGEATMVNPMEAGEAMIISLVGAEVEVGEEEKCKVAGQKGVEVVATRREEGATQVEVIRVDFRHIRIRIMDTREVEGVFIVAVVTSRITGTRMAVPKREVDEVGGVEEAVVIGEAREVAGVAEGVRTTTKEGNLSSTFNKVDISIIRQVLVKEDIIPVELRILPLQQSSGICTWWLVRRV
ncbi:protein FAM98A isoform X1 [Polypterus senegalus]|uniref:protein FAM98A isoform X1 n=1 Tax=Polypterus senegalus TaxID=55291 RepID=UPI001962929D|nr:protein FAM98A isoform X1 [Polypterus senegalus]